MPDSKAASYFRGLQGEAAAKEYLCKNGMTCLEQRYRSPYGEIDLIMLEGDMLVFAEVKARLHGTIRSAQLAVTPFKQQKIIQTALCYIAEHPEHAHRLMRFDIVSLAGDCVHHLANAFEGTGW